MNYRIRYVAQYSNTDSVQEYLYSPGGKAKMDYFLYCLNMINPDVEVFSTCQTKKYGIALPNKTKTVYGQKLQHIFSFRYKFKYANILNIIITQIQLFLYLLKTPADCVIYFYHERFYSPAIKLAMKLKKLKIVCDVEEIYTIHAQYTDKKIQQELKYLKLFKYYTLSGNGLAKTLNLRNSQYVVCGGVYAPIMENKKTLDNDISVLYAGTFDETKGGAFAAVEAFEKLTDKYNLNLCGFGTEKQIKKIKHLIFSINEINLKSRGANISYLGFIPNTSEKYRHILQKSKIGLSTQNPNGDYNNTSFPSKIFEYMRYGLKVVSTPIAVAQALPISKFITFIEEYTPTGIANAIKKSENIDVEAQSKVLMDMHNSFILNFKLLLENAITD